MFSTCLFFTFNFLTKNKYITKSESSPSSIKILPICEIVQCRKETTRHAFCWMKVKLRLEFVWPELYYNVRTNCNFAWLISVYVRSESVKCLSNTVPLQGYKCKWYYYSVLTTTVVKTFWAKVLCQKERD